MFERRKAKKLGIKDLGMASSKLPKIDGSGFIHHFWRHVSCGEKLREGRDLKTGAHISLWCPKCKMIVNRGYLTQQEK